VRGCLAKSFYCPGSAEHVLDFSMVVCIMIYSGWLIMQFGYAPPSLGGIEGWRNYRIMHGKYKLKAILLRHSSRPVEQSKRSTSNAY